MVTTGLVGGLYERHLAVGCLAKIVACGLQSIFSGAVCPFFFVTRVSYHYIFRIKLVCDRYVFSFIAYSQVGGLSYRGYRGE